MESRKKPAYIIQDMNHMENDRDYLLNLFSEPGGQGSIKVNIIDNFVIEYDNDAGKLTYLHINKPGSLVKEFFHLFDQGKKNFLQEIMDSCFNKKIQPTLK